MRLLSLTVRNFRAFGPAVETIQFGGDLVLFFGPNGFGKTSLTEAIEWLLYGYTKRRKRGEDFSKTEYAGCYSNIHMGGPTEVEATIERASGVHVIKRVLRPDETSVTFVDGAQAAFSGLGIRVIEAIHPIIAQNGLQSFIHSKPKERRDAISAALGLDELTAFKSSLESARASFQRTPPQAVIAARKALAALVPDLLLMPEVSSVAKRWQKVPVEVDGEEDLAILLRMAAKLAGSSETNPERILSDLRSRRVEASKSVFDIDAVRPVEEPTGPARRAVSAAVRAERALVAAKSETTRYFALLASGYSAALLDFWKTGLEFPPQGDLCPMCEADTLDSHRREELRQRIGSGAKALASRESLSRALAAAGTEISNLKTAIEDLGALGPLEAKGSERLKALLSDSPDILQQFETSFFRLNRSRTLMLELADQIETHEKGYLKAIEALDDAVSIIGFHDQLIDQIRPAVRSMAKSFGVYFDQWKEFEASISSKIASSDEVLRIDTIGKSIARGDDIRLLEKYAGILTTTQELIRSAEKEIQKKQTALLATRGKEVKELYDKLNVGADVGFEAMEPGNDNMKLHAVSFGKRMHAAANLSECQLNCLGLSAYLMRACSPGSPFNFIVLDDPVQSMDDGHTEAFLSEIVPHLLDEHNKQVIVLSHTRKIVDRLRQLNQARATRVYHFDSFALGGPTLTEQIGLRMLLAEINGAMKGNELNRAYAVDRMRVLAEHVVREVYLVQEKSPLPKKYDNANPSELASVFRTIQGTTPDEHSRLLDTMKFCDPAHHTEFGYSIPVRSNIEPHYQRLEGFLKKFGVLS